MTLRSIRIARKLTLLLSIVLVSGCTIDSTSTYQRKSYSTLKVNGKTVRNERSNERGSGKSKTVISLNSDKKKKEPKKANSRSSYNSSKKSKRSNSTKTLPKLDRETEYKTITGGEYTTTTAVNLRSKPDPESSKLLTISKEKIVYFTGKTKGFWWQVKVKGKHGWMSSKFLKKKEKSFGDRLKSLF